MFKIINCIWMPIVSNIVDGMFLSATKEFGTYELGSGVNYSINELADMFGKDYPKEYIEERVGEARETLCEKPDLLLIKNNLEDYLDTGILPF